jgi:hypothetical protein
MEVVEAAGVKGAWPTLWQTAAALSDCTCAAGFIFDLFVYKILLTVVRPQMYV